MNELSAAGQEKSKRYKQLFLVHEEQAEEEEQRDFNRLTKETKPLLNHASYACIGTSTCNKQRPITKLFPETLKHCEQLQQANIIKKVLKTTNVASDHDQSFASNSKNLTTQPESPGRN